MNQIKERVYFLSILSVGTISHSLLNTIKKNIRRDKWIPKTYQRVIIANVFRKHGIAGHRSISLISVGFHLIGDQIPEKSVPGNATELLDNCLNTFGQPFERIDDIFVDFFPNFTKFCSIDL